MTGDAQNGGRIVVTGGTGGLGSQVIRELLRLGEGEPLGVSVRNPDAARELGTLGIRVRLGDFDQPETLPNAFESAQRLLIISTLGTNEDRIRQHRNAIEAAVEAGVSRIYYTSIIQRSRSVFGPTAGHLQTEEDLAACGIPYTIFHNGQYIENLPMFLRWGLVDGKLALPPDGPTAWVSRRDLAEGIARVMLQDAERPQALILTGPRALDFQQIAAIAGPTLGRSIERRVIGGEEFIKRLVKKGMPRGAAMMFESGFRSRARGELGIVSPELERALGRPRRTVEQELPHFLGKEFEPPALSDADDPLGRLS